VLARTPTRRPVTRWFCGAALVASALAFGCRQSEGGHAASSGSPSLPREALPEGATPGPLGTPVRSEHYVIQALAFEPCATGRAEDRTGKTRRVGVELSIEPTGTVQVPANPYYATLVGADGDVFEATLGGCGAPLGPALPATGEAAQGWVVFEVPSSGRDFTLVYDPELVEVPEREVTIALRR
jgi:hypothetical protein